MIFDRLDHLRQYGNLPHGIPAAIDYLLRTDFARVSEGRYELDSDRLVAIVQRYRTRALEEAVWEAHRRYVDVQYVLQGTERMGHLLWHEGVAVKKPYDAQGDAILYDAEGSLFTAAAGDVAIFLPHDIHSPGLAAADGAAEVRKVVVKCRIE
jgi:YhcH/YjgK/YiaL family protein